MSEVSFEGGDRVVRLTGLEHAVFEQLDESVAVYDADGRYLYANPAMLRLLGQAPAAILGRSIWEIYPDAFDNPFSQALRRVIATGKAETLEHHYTPWDRWFDNRFFATPAGTCVVAIEITARKRAERRLETLVAVGRALDDARELGPALAAALGVLVPALADACSVWQYDEAGEERLIAAAPSAETEGAELRSAERLTLPIAHGGRKLGVFRLIRRNFATSADAGDQELLQEIAERIALACDADRLRRERAAAFARAERERRDAEHERERLRTLFDQAPAAIAVLRSPDWEYELSNPRNDELGGRGTLRGKKLRDVLPELHAQGFEGLLERVARSGEPFVGNEVRALVGEGEEQRELFLNGVYQPLRDATGRVDRIMAFAYDVSEQVRARQRIEALAARLQLSESRARRLQDSGVIGVVFWQRDGGLVDANDAFLAMVGYERSDLEQGGIRWSDMTPPEFAPLDLRALEELDATGICAPYEKEYVAKDGRRIPISLGIACWEGTRDSGVAWILDLTEKRRAQLEREQLLARERLARAQAEAANRSKDEFLAMVSHELRTPLTAILGWSRMLSAGLLDGAKQRRALEAIERNAQAQAQLVEDLLDVSRIVSGKLRLEVAPVSLAAVVDAAIDAVRPALESKHIELSTMADPDAGPTLGDANRLQQVVWNLLSNAVKFTPRGGKIRVVLRRVGSHLELSCADNGMGIRPSALAYVFDSFRQADSSMTRAYGGLGLGLSIVKHLVELHGGSVEAHSEGEGRGATFTVRLPLSPMLASAPAPAEARTATSGNALTFECPAELAGLRVLVVDDEPDARELVAGVLGHCGARVTTAGSAFEALRLVGDGGYDVMVSDIGMPGQDGYELIRRVRELPRERGGALPAAALTAYARSEDRKQAMMAGFQLHVPKPVEPAELTAVVACLARIGQVGR